MRIPFPVRLAAVAVGMATAIGVSAQERITVSESVLVEASASDTWNAVSNFADLGAWHPAVSKTEIATGDPTLRGAVRVLTIGDNVGTVTETLTAFDADAMRLSYVINSTDVLPVKDYAATMQVVPVGDDSALFVWNGSFLANGPSDEEVGEAMSGVYRAGLDNLKAMMTGG